MQLPRQPHRILLTQLATIRRQLAIVMGPPNKQPHLHVYLPHFYHSCDRYSIVQYLETQQMSSLMWNRKKFN